MLGGLGLLCIWISFILKIRLEFGVIMGFGKLMYNIKSVFFICGYIVCSFYLINY